MVVNRKNMVSYIMKYEEGKLTEIKTIQLFAYIIKMQMYQWLQGHYGRTAQQLIDSGVISKNGRINWKRYEELQENKMRY